MKNKKIINGDQFVHGGASGNHIRLQLDKNSNVIGINETIKISKCNDNDEFVITGKQLKELQKFWRKEYERL